MNSQQFLPGTGNIANLPLRRYLPPVTEGTTVAWLKNNIPASSWIIDPIGFNPIIPLEAAQAGYNILVCCNNPIISLMHEVLASSPTKEDLKSALAELSMLKRGDERLDSHLQSLYETACPSCKQNIQAQGYLWARGEDQPYARLIDCPLCGNTGEYPIEADDIDRLRLPGNPALHRSRAIERVSSQDDEIRPGIEEALRAYLPRALYFVTTLINKIEGSGIAPATRKLLWALVISICDDANSLWPWPSGRSRPRQLSIAPQFRENNLWLALESAIDAWSNQPIAIPITIWPQLPSEHGKGAICLFRGRLKSLLVETGVPQTKAAITAFPRPSQAFWTLSAIWSGWLWGKEAVQPLRATLDRLRYDWGWHASALYSAFHALRTIADSEHKIFGIIPELVPRFLSALVMAGHSAGFYLAGMALREDDATAQFYLRPSIQNSEKLNPSKTDPAEFLSRAVTNYLASRQEPASYLMIHAAALQGAAGANMFAPIIDNPAHLSHFRYFSDQFNKFETILHQALLNPKFYQRYGEKEQNLESGLWWLVNSSSQEKIMFNEDTWPLSDKIEKQIVHYLLHNPSCTYDQIVENLCDAFPGLITPPGDYVHICLESYGNPTLHKNTLLWDLRAEDSPAMRRIDLRNIQKVINEMGVKFGYTSSGELPILWKTVQGDIIYAFFPIASSIISRWVFTQQEPPAERCVIVFPGGRSRLLADKLRRDPHLAEKSRSWHFLKFRALRKLHEHADLDYVLFSKWLDIDPPDLEEARQMSIFDL